MNEKGKNILPMIGFILIVAVLMGGFAVARTFTGKTTTNQNTSKSGVLGGYTIDDTGDVSTNGINKITISAVSSEMNIKTHDSSSVEAHFYGKVSTVNKDLLPHLEVTREGNTAVVKIVYPKTINMSYQGQTTLDVLIPEEWEKDLEVGSVSGKINAPDLTGDSIRVSSVSGAIETENITGDDVRLNTTSGSFRIGKLVARDYFEKNTVSGGCEIDRVESEEVKLESTSGGTTIKSASIDKVTSNSISGEIEMTMENGSADLATTSGEISIKFEEDFKSFSANSVSGRVKLEIPENSEFKIDVNTVSGDIHCEDFSMKIISTKRNHLEAEVGDGDSTIEIHTTSSGVNIKKR